MIGKIKQEMSKAALQCLLYIPSAGNRAASATALFAMDRRLADMIQRDDNSNRNTFLTNSEAAEFLRLSPRTLEKQRVVGGGPPFRKFGRRVLYAQAELHEWAEGRKFDSTSQF